ncbi:hypothetical protein BDP27DRAFT_1424634 [Rhodocollybia butyracea]|uniref:Uncharacterized protein n=1 Tax=Rhodocollybia butyracea TaxID=206335 RepID=A0A9P5PLN9_9AGAR|nr:hypothetical protein BDP27DRAFT_1424634 [Rhodocollybia butyracea]
MCEKDGTLVGAGSRQNFIETVAESCFIQLRFTREVVLNSSICDYTDSPCPQSNDSETRISSTSLEEPIRKPKSFLTYSTVMHSPNIQPTLSNECSYTGHPISMHMDHQELCEIYRPTSSSEPQYETFSLSTLWTTSALCEIYHPASSPDLNVLGYGYTYTYIHI